MSAANAMRSIAVTAVLSAALIGRPIIADRNDHGRGGAPVTHGVSAGDVTSTSAVIWSRTNVETTMHVVLRGRGDDDHLRYATVPVRAEDDYTGKIRFSRLKPDTLYEYSVWFGSRGERSGAGRPAGGRFRTAPAPNDRSAVTFAWGGDVAGQNVCRDGVEGFPIFTAIQSSGLDFFIGLGDMIYADGVCNATGLYGNAQVAGTFSQAATMADFWGHWKYNREDAGYRTLLAQVPYYAIWDDHEVVNDFGPLHDTRSAPPYTAGAHLMPMGLDAMLDYNPILPASNTPNRLYRNIRWGKHLEMFFLDTRQYRDANFEADDPARPKTMLGREQVAWLKDVLSRSDATWKVIVSSVPMSIPTGSAGAAGRDGWANYLQTGGFELELLDILRHMQQTNERNVVWITTDVHFSEVFRYTPFADAPDFQIHEVVTGPMNAGVFPNAAFDATLGAASLFRYPVTSPTTYAEAKRDFNFGLITIAADGMLNVSINDVAGALLFELMLNPR